MQTALPGTKAQHFMTLALISTLHWLIAVSILILQKRLTDFIIYISIGLILLKLDNSRLGSYTIYCSKYSKLGNWRKTAGLEMQTEKIMLPNVSVIYRIVTIEVSSKQLLIDLICYILKCLTSVSFLTYCT